MLQSLTRRTRIRAATYLTAAFVLLAGTSLEKQTCTTSPTQIAALGAEIYGQAQAAQQAIGELPYAYVELTQTASFVSKVGDYAQALARSAATQGGYTGDQLETVKALSKASRQLSQTLDKLEQRDRPGGLDRRGTASQRHPERTELGRPDRREPFPDRGNGFSGTAHLDLRWPLLRQPPVQSQTRPGRLAGGHPCQRKGERSPVRRR